ncbi:MAG TPA: glycosyltransferase [Candidatus Latescibacteria bacterium]|nr:glycosyltransferase [Candidatus Latescibacterota bacterium]
MSRPTISIVLPVYNEMDAIRPVYEGVRDVLVEAGYDYEFVFANDGSVDGSEAAISALHASDDRVKLVSLSRNFGQQVAVTSGLEYASGDAVILMDCDMQDDPKAIPEFLDLWEKGYDVVYALRSDRQEGLFRRMAFKSFHRINHLLSDIRMPADAGLFCLMSRRVVLEMGRLKERNRYLPGMRFWVGFKQTGIRVRRLGRYDDVSRVSLSRLMILSLDSLVSHSKVPLRCVTLLGLLMFCVATGVASYVFYSKFISLVAIPGWASGVGLILFFGGFQFIVLGVLGEYLARIYDEVKMRPLYVVASTLGSFARRDRKEPS